MTPFRSEEASLREQLRRKEEELRALEADDVDLAISRTQREREDRRWKVVLTFLAFVAFAVGGMLAWASYPRAAPLGHGMEPAATPAERETERATEACTAQNEARRGDLRSCLDRLELAQSTGVRIDAPLDSPALVPVRLGLTRLSPRMHDCARGPVGMTVLVTSQGRLEKFEIDAAHPLSDQERTCVNDVVRAASVPEWQGGVVGLRVLYERE